MSNNHQKNHQTPASDPIMGTKDHHRWTEGDFVLVSADDVRFRIDSTLLCWASPVLKDAIEIGSKGKKVLRLTDMEIESSNVLSNFLSLVTSGALKWPHNGTYTNAEAFYNLISFLRKYDGERPLKTLREKIVNQLLLENMPPFYVLMSAVAMDDVELSILAFQESYPVKVKSGEKPFISAELLSLSPGSTLEDSTWPSQVLHRFPVDYLWACTKAWTAKWGSNYYSHKRSLSDHWTSFSQLPSTSSAGEISIASEYKKAIRTVRPSPKPKK